MGSNNQDSWNRYARDVATIIGGNDSMDEREQADLADYIATGAFHRELSQGLWHVMYNETHPRGLIGCEYLTSWEVQLRLGLNLCNPGTFRTLRSVCPVSCGCGAGIECPSSCVSNISSDGFQ